MISFSSFSRTSLYMNDSNLTDKFIRIRPMRTEDIAPLVKAANEDGHEVILPTHIIEKGGDIVGALSMNSVPTVLHWMDTEKCSVRDSLNAMNFFENFMSGGGAQSFILPCSDKSPYISLIEKMGYAKAGSFTIFIKKPKA